MGSLLRPAIDFGGRLELYLLVGGASLTRHGALWKRRSAIQVIWILKVFCLKFRLHLHGLIFLTSVKSSLQVGDQIDLVSSEYNSKPLESPTCFKVRPCLLECDR